MLSSISANEQFSLVFLCIFQVDLTSFVVGQSWVGRQTRCPIRFISPLMVLTLLSAPSTILHMLLSMCSLACKASLLCSQGWRECLTTVCLVLVCFLLWVKEVCLRLSKSYLYQGCNSKFFTTPALSLMSLGVETGSGYVQYAVWGGTSIWGRPSKLSSLTVVEWGTCPLWATWQVWDAKRQTRGRSSLFVQACQVMARQWPLS